jgi:magnesium chelatase family protein
VRERVLAARERQRERGQLPNADVRVQDIAIDAEVERMLARTGAGAGLSGRGRERVIRIARTVADLAASEPITRDHVAEAIALRRRERS